MKHILIALMFFVPSLAFIGCGEEDNEIQPEVGALAKACVLCVDVS